MGDRGRTVGIVELTTDQIWMTLFEKCMTRHLKTSTIATTASLLTLMMIPVLMLGGGPVRGANLIGLQVDLPTTVIGQGNILSETDPLVENTHPQGTLVTGKRKKVTTRR